MSKKTEKPVYAFIRRGNRGHKMPIPVERQLEERSMPVPFCGCHLWMGALTTRGYGKMTFDKATLLAHRVSWEISNGTKAPSGMYVCHSCDQPSCVNPDHLFLGSPQENSDDMVRKGRSRRGAENARSKLNSIDIDHIRRTDLGTTVLSGIYDVSKTTIKNIRSGRAWNHV